MTLAAIAFTAQGYALGERLAGQLRAQGDTVRLARGFGRDKHMPLPVWTRDAMLQCDGLVFIGATGIAVRAIAPCLRGKLEDPAVVVLDEGGRFAISLLSGHVGGGNRLALRVAQAVGAQPVVTTATDGRGVFAADLWAKAQDLVLVNPGEVKAVSAALLAGTPVGLVSDFPIRGAIPGGLMLGEQADVGIYIGLEEAKAPFPITLHAVPRVLAVGMGCRRDVAKATLAARLADAVARFPAGWQAIQAVHTIDRKAREPGLVALCAENGWPLRAFSAEELAAVPGTFSASAFVQSVVGVENVCERAAVAAGGGLLLSKQAGDGVTVAIAALPYTVSFEEEAVCASRL